MRRPNILDGTLISLGIACGVFFLGWCWHQTRWLRPEPGPAPTLPTITQDNGPHPDLLHLPYLPWTPVCVVCGHTIEYDNYRPEWPYPWPHPDYRLVVLLKNDTARGAVLPGRRAYCWPHLLEYDGE